MIRRILSRWENLQVNLPQWILTFLAFVLVRLQTEVLFLDFHRSPEFVVVNIGYFFSVVLCMALLLKGLTGEKLEPILRAALPFSAVFLLPLLDLFFYPGLRGDDLLKYCYIPLFAEWDDYIWYLTSQMLSQAFFVNPGISIGLRLEVLIGGAVVFSYVLAKASHWTMGLLKGALAYLVYLCLVYAHVILVLHPAMGYWIFPPLVFAESLVCLALFHRPLIGEWAAHVHWQLVFFLGAAMTMGYGLGMQSEMGGAGEYSELFPVAVSLLALGLFAGCNEAPAEAGPGGWPRRWARNISWVFCLLATYPVHPFVFLSFALLLALVYLLQSSPFQLMSHTLLASLVASLAFWVSAWTGQLLLWPSPRALPNDLPGLTQNMGPSMPMGGPAMTSMAPAGGIAETGRASDGSSAMSQPNRPTPGLPMAGQPAPPLWPEWLYHPLWLLLLPLTFGLLVFGKPRLSMLKPTDSVSPR